MSKKKVVESFRTKAAIYELQEVYCGKETCTKCPHGPYWYVKFKVGNNTVTKYIGKKLILLNQDDCLNRKKYERLQPIFFDQGCQDAENPK